MNTTRMLGAAGLAWALLLAGCGGGPVASPVDPHGVPGPMVHSPPQARPVRTPPPPPPAPRPHAAPSVRTMHLGKSVRGKDLTVTVLGSGERPVFVFGAIHGDEPASAVVAARLIDELKRDPAPGRACPVAVLPAANPDGLAIGLRANARGVDLNRNFPARNWKKAEPGRYYGGPAPASEIETQALVRAVEQLQPRLIIAIHAIGRGGQCNNYDGPALAVAKAMAPCNGYPVKATIGYPTPGSLGSWAGGDRKTPVITLELPAGIAGEDCWKSNREALLAAIRHAAAM